MAVAARKIACIFVIPTPKSITFGQNEHRYFCARKKHFKKYPVVNAETADAKSQSFVFGIAQAAQATTDALEPLSGAAGVTMGYPFSIEPLAKNRLGWSFAKVSIKIINYTLVKIKKKY